MSKIYKIRYVDAYYSYAKTIKKSMLSVHEAWGFVKYNKDSIIISLVRRHGKSNDTLLGLVIPDTSLVNSKKSRNFGDDNKIAVGNQVSIQWRDVVIFDDTDVRNSCSIMYTEGTLYKICDDHVVIKNPETIRVSPNKILNHPIKKPKYYIIPISFISEIAKIDHEI